ncbi:DNA polymerase ligase N-terminal domain-containing protein [Lignipirellula cremea]|uniref:DNA ligase D 3'-phosphoesterase domain-containing protein n=1 Tax=Lignipirellula cremea TaxID=2528010 RepID=A0A518DQA6_9BACT|nr:DNA polymerase ligase N-terminal domain-containing protein [Lignipirellula cremea]QDU93994.1 hypothetical protein Pla8534_17800 [Lignipirellula cremea]
MPRFALLKHETPVGYPRPTHWDLLLEQDESLAAWALAAELTPGVVIPAEALAPHRLVYLDYEGPVSGDRGVVSRVDTGEYAIREQAESRWRVELYGALLRGTVVLQQAADQRWSVAFKMAAV